MNYFKISKFLKYGFLILFTISTTLKSVTYTAIGCPGPVTWSGFSAGGSPFWNGGTQLTSQPLAGDVLVIPSSCTINVSGIITANNTITLNINGRLNFPTSGDKLNLEASSRINVPTGGSISGGSSSNQIKIGAGGAEWSGPGTSSGPFNITNGVLPIELINFSGNCKSNGVHLFWSTATELNNNYFLLERSETAINWTGIAKIDGNRTKNTISNYHYLDESVVNQKLYYYRLNQVDFDGSSKNYHIIYVECENYFENEMNIFPNPSKLQGVISFSLNINKMIESATLRIINHFGQTVFERTLYNLIGTNTFSFPIEIESGIYQVLLISDHNIIRAKKLLLHL